MVTPEYCQTMAHYNRWINARLYAVCARFDDAERKRDRGAFFGSMHRTLNHLLWGDRVWLGRIVDTPYVEPAFGADLYADFDTLAYERGLTDRELESWADSETSTHLASTLDYRSSVDGKVRRLSVAVAVVHMFNHGTHHRGQLTTLLRQVGADPGPMDLPWVPGVVQILD
jgi:uncharacterized damage-inducible protein DinB